MVDKLMLDVPTTRQHWYPKWLLFNASGRGQERCLVLRNAVGQHLCDTAIETGVALPIPRNKQAVCDAMRAVDSSFSGLRWMFYNLLEKQVNDTSGWILFLEAAAKRFAEWHVIHIGGPEAINIVENQDLIKDAVEVWRLWYNDNLRCCECVADDGGSTFFRALVDTKRCIERIVDLGVVAAA